VAPLVLRDYQIEAIDLCADLTTVAPAYIVLPTGTGKSAIIVHSVMRVLHADPAARAIVYVPFINLMEQTAATFRDHEVDIDCVGGGRTRNLGARLSICVFNSAHLVDVADYVVQFIDEAHVACCPLVYRQHEEQATDADARDPDASSTGYAAVRAVAALPTARLLSATLDIPDAAPRVTRELRAMIAAHFLMDYQLHVPLFRRGTRDSTIARHLADNYQSLLVFAPRRATGLAFCAELNQHTSGARFIDCDTPAEERRETLELFKAGIIWCIVSVRTLAIGFDAPITTAVCFLHMPSSATFAVQVVGRALRLHPGKRMSSVVLPLVCGDGDSNDQCAARARDFMRILAHVDTRFALALRRRGVGYVDVSIADDDGAELLRDDAAELLRMEIFDSMGRAVRGLWETNLAAFVQYRADHDGSYPPRAGPFAWLSNWTHNQRQTHYTMSEEQRGALNAIGFCWNALDEKWERMRFKVALHRATHGTLPVQGTEGGSWANRQLVCKRNGTLRADRILILEAIPGWVWDPHDAAWDRNYSELRELGRMPPSNSRLGRWANKQRRTRGTRSADQLEKLEALPGWTWDHSDAMWQEKYAELSALGSMPPVRISRLYQWVRNQRRNRATMSADHTLKLVALEFWAW
jgi:superfamily II DNA or RNA helicase